jgi:hypothetical protein
MISSLFIVLNISFILYVTKQPFIVDIYIFFFPFFFLCNGNKDSYNLFIFFETKKQEKLHCKDYQIHHDPSKGSREKTSP